jgi:CheY-like chemotaxis protein
MTAAAPIILVVEDEALVQVLLVDVLEERGYAVRAAASAAEALTLLREHCGDIDVLLTDINLGPGDTGLDLARQARALCPGIPVIYVTGGAYTEALTARVPDSLLIPKPYELGHICEEVARVLPPRGAG